MLSDLINPLTLSQHPYLIKATCSCYHFGFYHAVLEKGRKESLEEYLFHHDVRFNSNQPSSCKCENLWPLPLQERKKDSAGTWLFALSLSTSIWLWLTWEVPGLHVLRKRHGNHLVGVWLDHKQLMFRENLDGLEAFPWNFAPAKISCYTVLLAV